MKSPDSRTVGIVTILATIAAMLYTAPLFAASPSPNLTIDPTDTKPVPAVGSGFDTFLYVRVPTAVPVNPTLHNLLTSFIVLQIDYQFVQPDGTVDPVTNLVTCTQVGYPSRNTVVSCSGAFPFRVMPRVYAGSNTGIYHVGWANISTKGVWTLTYTVTGLFNGATIVLTASVKFNVDPPATSGPVIPV